MWAVDTLSLLAVTPSLQSWLNLRLGFKQQNGSEVMLVQFWVEALKSWRSCSFRLGRQLCGKAQAERRDAVIRSPARAVCGQVGSCGLPGSASSDTTMGRKTGWSTPQKCEKLRIVMQWLAPTASSDPRLSPRIHGRVQSPLTLCQAAVSDQQDITEMALHVTSEASSGKTRGFGLAGLVLWRKPAAMS